VNPTFDQDSARLWAPDVLTLDTPSSPCGCDRRVDVALLSLPDDSLKTDRTSGLLVKEGDLLLIERSLQAHLERMLQM